MTRTTYKTVQAVKAGDWTLPILVNGVTVYALQINKSKEDKNNIDTILSEYHNAGIEVYEYAGKNNNPVLLVNATKKIKTQRVSASTEDMISELTALGVSEEVARKAIASAKAKKAQK